MIILLLLLFLPVIFPSVCHFLQRPPGDPIGGVAYLRIVFPLEEASPFLEETVQGQ